MDLILWRHSEAEDGVLDLERRLTSKGHKQAARMAAWLLQRLPSRFKVITSPAVRARQTAEALGTTMKIVPGLSPGADVSAVLKAAEWPRAKGATVVVGHQPTFGLVAAYLIGGNAIDLSIRKGAIWWLTYRERDGETQVVVRAVVSPDML